MASDVADTAGRGLKVVLCIQALSMALLMLLIPKIAGSYSLGSVLFMLVGSVMMVGATISFLWDDESAGNPEWRTAIAKRTTTSTNRESGAIEKTRQAKEGFWVFLAIGAIAAALAGSWVFELWTERTRDALEGSLAGLLFVAVFASLCWTTRPRTTVRRITPASANMSAEQVEAMIELGRLSEAKDHAQRLVAQKPDQGGAHSALGRCLLMMDDPDHALKSIETALVLDPQSGYALRLKAHALMQLNKPHLAVNHLKQALATDPLDADLHLLLSHAHTALSRWTPFSPYRRAGSRGHHRSSAFVAAKTACELEPLNPEAINQLSRLQPDRERRYKIARQALSASPSDPKTQLEFGLAALKFGETNEATETLVSAAKSDPKLANAVASAFRPGPEVYLIGLAVAVVWIGATALVWFVFARESLAAQIALGLGLPVLFGALDFVFKRFETRTLEAVPEQYRATIRELQNRADAA